MNLHAILREAYLQEKINRNPASRIEVKTSAPQKTKIILSPVELLRLADTIAPRFRAQILLAGVVGLRAAECAGLQVTDLNLTKGVAIIRATNSEVGGKLHYTDTKTSRVREVPLPSFMCRCLDAHIAHFPSKEGFVFTSPNGGPLRHGDFYRRHFKPAVEAAGIDPAFEFRWLRDTSVSNGRHLAGQPTKVMQLVVGHSTEAMTQDVYSHLPAGAMDDLKLALERIFKEAADLGGTETQTSDARLLHAADSEVISMGARTYVPTADQG